jgi:hypothetical protein
MKRIPSAFVCIIMLSAFSIQAQTPAEDPKPAPEVQKLAYWVGTWKAEAGEDSETTTFEWFAGGFGVIGRTEGTSAEGKYSSITICSYNPEAKTYTLYILSSNHPGRMAKGTAIGNTWYFETEGTVDGKPAKYRQTIVEVTPMLRTFRAEKSVDGGPWTLISMGRATKVK